MRERERDTRSVTTVRGEEKREERRRWSLVRGRWRTAVRYS